MNTRCAVPLTVQGSDRFLVWPNSSDVPACPYTRKFPHNHLVPSASSCSPRPKKSLCRTTRVLPASTLASSFQLAGSGSVSFQLANPPKVASWKIVPLGTSHRPLGLYAKAATRSRQFSANQPEARSARSPRKNAVLRLKQSTANSQISPHEKITPFFVINHSNRLT